MYALTKIEYGPIFKLHLAAEIKATPTLNNGRVFFLETPDTLG